MRKAFFWLHLLAGVVAGAIILIMSVTGVLLAYESQITRWADGYRVPPPSPGAARASVEALTSRVHAAKGKWPSSVTLRADASLPAEFAFGREGTTYADPHTGAILGEGSARARAFFRGVTDWHRWLAVGGEARGTARAITGASNLAFLFIVLSGLILWLPSSFTARQLRPITWFLGRAKGRARDFNWHHVFGIWALVPLVFVVGSGVVISYPWANQLLQRAVGGTPEVRGERGGPGPGGPGGERAARGGGERGGDRAGAPEGGPRGEGQVAGRGVPSAGGPGGPGGPGGAFGDGPRDVDLAGVDQAWAAAQAHIAGWQSVSLRLPATPDAPWSFSIDTSTGARRPDTRTQLTLDRTTGATLKVEGYEAVPVGRKAIGWNRFIHTGEAFGIVGQTIAGVASLSAAMLVWTGIALSLRRFAAWRKRKSPRAAAA